MLPNFTGHFKDLKVPLLMSPSFQPTIAQGHKDFLDWSIDTKAETWRIEGSLDRPNRKGVLELMSSCSKYRALSQTPCCVPEISENLQGKGVSGTNMQKGTLDSTFPWKHFHPCWFQSMAQTEKCCAGAISSPSSQSS